MAVYVDEITDFGPKGFWCHMMADNLDELHDMAARIGLRREWFQDKSDYPHYDLKAPTRALAVSLGALEVTTMDLVERFGPSRPPRRSISGQIQHGKDQG